MNLTLGAVAAAAMLWSAVASAEVRCIASDEGLAIALHDAQIVPYLTIELVQNTYHLDNTVWHSTHGNETNQGTTLLGGYTSNCAGRSIAVGNTVLRDDSLASGDTDGVTGALNLLLIEGITFEVPTTFGSNVSYSFSPTLTIQRSAFVGGGMLTFSAADDLNDPGGSLTAYVENTLVAGNAYGGFGCGIGGYALGGLIGIEVINSTIVDNAGSAGVCGVGIDPGVVALDVVNSIVWNNSGVDIQNNSTATGLVDVIYGSHNWPGIGSEVNSLHLDPQLKADYHLTEPTSPAIDSGTTNVPLGLTLHDLDGGPRLVGLGVDRGAFESSVKANFAPKVKNTDDSGPGSLRQAMIDAIANGSGFISFDIDSVNGCGPHLIVLQSELPDITVPLYISGYTQNGALRYDLDYGFDATICIAIKAASTSVTHAFRVPATGAAGASAVIEGFDFGGFGVAPVVVFDGTDNAVTGNRFGVINGVEYTEPYDIFAGSGVSGMTIGGSDAGSRNLILTATTAGVWLDDDGATHAANHNQIVGNYIGMGWANGQLVAHGNTGIGVNVRGSFNTIADNFIGYNGDDGVQFAGTLAHHNTLTGNTIGGTSANDGNGANGVTVQGDAHDNDIIANTIDYNTLRGVRVVNGLHKRISKNYIAGNGALGIDLGEIGVAPIDDDSMLPAPDYANRGQNFPVPTGAIGGHFRGTASASLTTTPGDYKIEVFGAFTCDDSHHGEGAPFIASRTIRVPLPASGNINTKDFSIDIAAPGEPLLNMPPLITMTATDVAGNTSEFSRCEAYVDDTLFADGFDPSPFAF